MYYLKIIVYPGNKGSDGKYKFKNIKYPIDQKTFELLYNSMFMWWSPGLAKDFNNQTSEIEDKLNDVFYIAVDKIIKNKLGMTPNVDFEYLDIDATNNEVEVYITFIK